SSVEASTWCRKCPRRTVATTGNVEGGPTGKRRRSRSGLRTTPTEERERERERERRGCEAGEGAWRRVDRCVVGFRPSSPSPLSLRVSLSLSLSAQSAPHGCRGSLVFSYCKAT